MVIKTKQEDNGQFVNLMTTAKNLAKTDTSEFVEVLRDDVKFNLIIKKVLCEIKSKFKTNSDDRDIRLFANNPHLIIQHDEILENLVFDIDYRFFNSKTNFKPGGKFSRDHRYLLEITKLNITGVPDDINKKMYKFLTKNIKKLEVETAYVFNNLINTKKPSVELDREETIKRISQYLTKKLSIFNQLDLDSNLGSNKIEFYIDSDSKLSLYHTRYSSKVGHHNIKLSTKDFSTSWMNKNLIQMLIDPRGEGYENLLKYYAKKAKEDFEEFYKKILLSDNCFEFKDFLSGSQPIWLISDEQLKSGLLQNDSMKKLIDMFQFKCDPEQNKRVIRIVSEILEEMDSNLPF